MLFSSYDLYTLPEFFSIVMSGSHWTRWPYRGASAHLLFTPMQTTTFIFLIQRFMKKKFNCIFYDSTTNVLCFFSLALSNLFICVHSPLLHWSLWCVHTLIQEMTITTYTNDWICVWRYSIFNSKKNLAQCHQWATVCHSGVTDS